MPHKYMHKEKGPIK